MTTTHDDPASFFTGLPHWIANAGLSPSGAERAAATIEDLVQLVLDAGFPPAAVDGPDPTSFPPPSDRIAAAANQLEGLLCGLDSEGWDTIVGGATIRLHAERAERGLRSLATNEHHDRVQPTVDS